jgi:hypothetical protein
VASLVYTNAKTLFLTGAIDLATATNIQAALVSGSYTPAATDEYWSTPEADVIGTPVTLTGNAVSGGAFSAYAATFDAVASGSTVVNVVVFENTGTATTSPLICVFTGFAQVTNGGNITVDWDGTATASAAGELFAL